MSATAHVDDYRRDAGRHLQTPPTLAALQVSLLEDAVEEPTKDHDGVHRENVDEYTATTGALASNLEALRAYMKPNGYLPDSPALKAWKRQRRKRAGKQLRADRQAAKLSALPEGALRDVTDGDDADQT